MTGSRFLLLVLISLSVFRCDDPPQILFAGQRLVIQAERPQSRLGASGDIVGDINGDGFADLVVGSPGEKQTGQNAGAASIYFGSAAGVGARHAVIVGGPDDRFGTDVAGLGDVNGDGFEDFAVSAKGSAREGILQKSVVFVFFGAQGGLLRTQEEIDDSTRFAETADVIIVGQETVQNAPAVSSAGDLDQNGALDLAIGEPEKNRVYVFLNGSPFPQSTRLLFSQANLILEGEGEFGKAVAATGDVNGENRGLASRFGDDLLIGAPKENDAGAAYLILGRGGLPLGTLSVASLGVRYQGPAKGSEFGTSVAGIGDFDANGFRDIAIGAPKAGAGQVLIFWGESIQGPSSVGSTTIQGEVEGDEFGSSISGALPQGISGKLVLVAGAPGNDFGAEDAGSAYILSNAVFTGDSTPRGAVANAAFADTVIRNVFAGSGGAAWFGARVKSGPDTNGDGSGDLLVGAPQAILAGEDAGGFAFFW